jgi:perosamine synthetase
MKDKTKCFPIPVYRPSLKGNEKKYVNDCLESGWISSRGEYIFKLEKCFSEFINVPAATTVANGTVALHLALHALGVGPGDEVIVPTLTYIASVNAIAYVGAKPVFVDCCPDTWNVDPEDVKSKITPRTRALMVVHLYGNPSAMSELQTICQENDLLMVEDAAEAFGSKYNGKYIGCFGDFATFSFFGNKTITTGEGGMLTSHSRKLIERAAHLKNQGVSSAREYWHDEVAFNFRMTNICAAIGLAQLERADEILEYKKNIYSWYVENLSDTDIQFQKVEDCALSSYWMVTILVRDLEQRNGLREHLKINGIETRPVFHPVHQMPVFYSSEKFPNAEHISARGLNLPSFPELSEHDVKEICECIKHFIN